jgi:hypothetical protein
MFEILCLRQSRFRGGPKKSLAAKAIGIEIPQSIALRADGVIE